MRIESVTAHAFGPLAGDTLRLAPGMTVITGVNESAKSSWHAAVYSALCGRRRGRGAPTKDEKRFAELHRPWDATEWRVSAVIVLADGRRIELVHDLDGKVDCRATDLALSRDVSADIMFEGSPDASRYLGLDRKSFAATAVVNQAELLTILGAAEGLQDHLQRAAATAGTDTTAAAALTALDKFKTDHVGLDRANSTKPLRTAKNALAQAEADLAAAVADHEQYLHVVAAAETNRDTVTGAEAEAARLQRVAAAFEELLTAARRVAAAQAVADRAQEKAADRADDENALAHRVAKATMLTDRVGDSPPAGLTGQDEVSRTVAAALAAWQAAPTPRTLTGPTADQLRADLEALPVPPTGDLQVDPAVRSAAVAHSRAVAVAAAHAEQEPARPPTSDELVDAAVAAGPAVVRDLAAQLRAATPGTDAAVAELGHAVTQARARQSDAAAAVARAEQAEAAARHQHHAATTSAPVAPNPTQRPRRSRVTWFVVAAIAAVFGVTLILTNRDAAGIAALATAVALAGGVAARGTGKPSTASGHRSPAVSGRDPQAAAVDLEHATAALAAARQEHLNASRRLAELEGRYAAATSAVQGAAAARAEVEARATARNLPTDPVRLQQLAALAEQVLETRTIRARWQHTAADYGTDVTHAEARLRDVLASRAAAADPTLEVTDLVAAYEADCAHRAEQAVAAARRPALEQALADRVDAEQAVAAARAARTEAMAGLVHAAHTAGLTGVAEDNPVNPVEVVDALRTWQAEHAARLGHVEAAQRDWADLQALLDGATLDDLRRDLDQVKSEAETLATEAAAAVSAARSARTSAEVAAVAAGVDVAVVDDVDTAAKLVEQARQDLAEAGAVVRRLAAVAENSSGVAAERARSLVSVAEAEEAVAAATAELARVTELEQTLALTQSFLAAAQEQVHRDIAPVLADTLRSWLPSVTGGRYVDAAVDPATLEVRVCGPSRRWREADRLSIGTAEQVYLLLRVALAQHLATTDEPCPLLLDDVTVQADDDRTREILDLLLRLSADRQVVLFGQEPIVAQWARERLAGTGEHAIVELDRVTAD